VLRVSPTSEAEAADAVREAADKNASLAIIAGGTKRDYGRPVAADAILDMRAVSGIVKYEPEELVLSVRAGTPISEIAAVLAEKKQMLGFEPADWGPLFGADRGRATIGGVVATNACGSRRVKAGAVRDHVIGCRFVNGKGEIIKAGGHVIKNVTGFDLPKLMCGAFGTLGVLTEITLRVSPLPENAAVVAIDCDAEIGFHLLREAAKLPLDVSGLAYIRSDRMGTAYIRVEGTATALDQKVAELQRRFAGQRAKPLDDGTAQRCFREFGDGSMFVAADADLWRLCVPATRAYEALLAARTEKTGPWSADWGGGLLWLGLPADEDTATRLRGITARFGGHATLMRAAPEARAALFVFEPETLARAAITRSVKAAFDPKGVLNPGRMFEGI
jgi:glycolate oxidase FAD binding subunit